MSIEYVEIGTGGRTTGILEVDRPTNIVMKSFFLKDGRIRRSLLEYPLNELGERWGQVEESSEILYAITLRGAPKPISRAFEIIQNSY